MKILIDNNVKQTVHLVLKEFGYFAETAKYHGLQDLSNGQLTKAAFNLGFRCILTQDKFFQKDAAQVLKSHPEMAIVLIDTLKLKQLPRDDYLERFKLELTKKTITPIAGKLTIWPE